MTTSMITNLLMTIILNKNKKKCKRYDGKKATIEYLKQNVVHKGNYSSNDILAEIIYK